MPTSFKTSPKSGLRDDLAIRFDLPSTNPVLVSKPSNTLVFPEGYCIGASEAMTALHRRLCGLLRGGLPVLIHGETGVGKELIARILHGSSDRAAGPFVAINCAAIPKDLLEAELFGVAGRVATGVERRVGTFEEAAGGTLFLDEVGELDPSLQPKLLRALQEKEIRPLGGRPRHLDARVIAATNVSPESEGTLRRDLYYRLAGALVEVPPLRDRRDDIQRLVKHFLERHLGEAGSRPLGVTSDAILHLRDYGWPGNVRQLEHEMRRLAYQPWDGVSIDVDSLDPRIRRSGAEGGGEAPRFLSLALAPRVEALERKLIREALMRTGGHRGKAARLLELSRNGLAKKLKRLGLEETWALPSRA